MWLLDDELRVVEANAGVSELYGYPPEKLRGMLSVELLTEAELTETPARVDELQSTGALFGERDAVTASGAVIRVQFAGHRIQLAERDLFFFVTLSAHAVPLGPDLLTGVSEADVPDTATLSPREREVVALVAAGLTGPDIARELQISFETVRSHVRNALLKTDTHTRAQLVAKALAENLIGD